MPSTRAAFRPLRANSHKLTVALRGSKKIVINQQFKLHLLGILGDFRGATVGSPEAAGLGKEPAVATDTIGTCTVGIWQSEPLPT